MWVPGATVTRQAADTHPQPRRTRTANDGTTVYAYAPPMMGKRHPGPTATMPRPLAGAPAIPSDPKVRAMIHPSDPQFTRPLAVRGGQGAPVICAACGCRLDRTGEAWFHFNPLGGRDARGCRVACADAAHDPSGRPVSVAV